MELNHSLMYQLNIQVDCAQYKFVYHSNSCIISTWEYILCFIFHIFVLMSIMGVTP
jgi:hypothetical protein